MPLLRLALLATLELATAAAQLTTQCHFVGFEDSSESRPTAYTAKCSRSPGGPMEICSQLSLEHCLSNHDGEMRPRTEGNSTPNFKETCRSCHVDVDGRRLYCQCKRLDMSLNYASVELESIIVPQGGLLTCSDTVGEEISECPVTRLGRPTDRRRLAP
ncbi:hypothetical protein G6O67_007767 [Ophiocordyceps sinensis]|uniref:Cyanovirin-N domain-containing protein n=2 Tax=Ophiocordyceps sinensis TaxID=72228 RepID=A0A8H4LUI4_9HYPO|nr:Cyanovirin-N [Ophiocordyceps sinensis CO18]KAF4505863.1 hypothetical protein G6O67_007767 [Ophiocordyceps sinensis]